MLAAALSIAVALAPAAIPPLTAQERAELETARDGGDHRETAFATLLAHAARWTPGPGDAPLRLEPDLDTMLADPDAYRGDLCRLHGIIQQQAPLDPPFGSAREWFLRDDAGRPILVYIAGLPPEARWRDGQRVTVLGRFYKRVEAAARDGRRRAYPAFVGAHPQSAAAPAGAAGSAASPPTPGALVRALAVPLAILMAIFLVLAVIVRRGAGRAGRGDAGSTLAPIGAGAVGLEPDPTLPDDPAEALAELKRRAASEP